MCLAKKKGEEGTPQRVWSLSITLLQVFRGVDVHLVFHQMLRRPFRLVFAIYFCATNVVGNIAVR